MKHTSVLCVFFDPSIGGGDRLTIAGKIVSVLSDERGICLVQSVGDADVAFFPKEIGRSLLVWRTDGETTEIFSPVSPSVIGIGHQNGFWDQLLALSVLA